MESHVVRQMRTTPGGIGMLMEHWIEQYHQIGLTEMSATIELNKKEVILAKLIGEEDMDDLNELEELEMKMFSKIID